jgi:TonB family protein
METDPAKESQEKPKDETFESNANSIGASELPATGDLPLPSQEGKDRPAVDLETHDYSLPTDGSKPAPQAQTKAEQPPSQASKPAKTDVSEPVPTPAAAIPTPKPEQFAMLKATPPPVQATEEPEPSPPPAIAESPMPQAPAPKPERAVSSYQAQKEATRITGGLTSRGHSAVNAVGTPLGRYQKAVSDAIGSRWYYHIDKKRDLVSIGTVRIEADVDAQGRVQNLRVVSNSANEAFANICLQSFQEAHIPPIPPDLVTTMPDGRLHVDFSFTNYAN